MKLAAAWLALATIAAACARGVASRAAEPAIERAPAGDVLVYGGAIYLGAPDWRRVDALLARDGAVLAVGSRAVVEALAHPDARRVDLRGATAVPGIQDAHGHVEGLGRSLETLDLRGCASFGELIERVAERARELRPGAWIEGRGWDQNLWPEPVFPHHAELSARVPDHPVVLRRVDGHALLANALALRLAGVDREFAREDEVAGGRIVLGADRRPSGVFVDAAMSLVAQAVPEPDDAARARWILAAQEHLLSLGVTAVHDMGEGAPTIQALRSLDAAGELELRVLGYRDPSLMWASDAEAARAGAGRGRFEAVGVKLYADGALGSRGAALLEPYADEPSQAGLMQLAPELLDREIARAIELGLQPAVHAIGDRANREVLDAYERALRRDPTFADLRPRVEHAQVVAPEDWPRFAALGVVPSMQPTHCTSDMRWADERLGPRRIEGAYAWRKLAPDTSALAFGSDFPVEAASPLLGLYAARTRQDASGWPRGGFAPDQRLTAEEALAAFTSGAARAARQDATRGRLAPGYAADLSAFDVDLLRCDPLDLLGARCTLAMIDGEVAFDALSAPRASR